MRSCFIIVCLLELAVLLSSCGETGGFGSSGGGGQGGGETVIDTLFADGFEGGADNWTADPYWSLSEIAQSGDSSLQAWDGVNSASGAEINIDFDLTDYTNATLNFWSRTTYALMRPGGAVTWVLTEANDQPLQTEWADFFQFDQPWTKVSISLDEYCGWVQKFEIAFWYYKYQSGTILWWIDDVEIIAERD